MKFYVTTPIYYVNAKPHLGHTYTTIAADVGRRFHDMKGEETFFLTGTDEHGDKIVKAAAKNNESPKTYADRISDLFRKIWPELNVSFDRFIRTTDPDHIAVVKHILTKIFDSGDIYFSEYEGLYCYDCERFYNTRELIDGKCPDHQTKPAIIRESNYFFSMGKYQDWLIDHIKKNPDFIRPERYRNEVLGFLREPLEDLCISRPKTRLTWGITLPFDKNYVTYVWFDALINYISAIGFPDGKEFKKFWPYANHVIAKDILKPHGIYWPIILKAAGIDIFRHLHVHGYWNIDESKMSKSIGNVVDPIYLKETYGTDAIRYFLMREMSFGLDSNFSENAIITRINADLANDLGNLFSRTLGMFHKYFKGVVPKREAPDKPGFELDLKSAAITTIENFCLSMEHFEFHKALSTVWEFISVMNKYIDTTAPWELARRKSGQKELTVVIRDLLEGLRVVSGLIYAVMPETASTMQTHLGLDRKRPFFLLEEISKWDVLSAGSVLPKSTALFPRIDVDRIETGNETSGDSPLPDIKPQIEINDLLKIDLRAVKVLDAEKIKKSDKLLKLTVALGDSTRTIVAGIAKTYAPSDLIGKTVIIVANLKPVKLMGVLSEGMVLAAVEDDGCAVAITDRAVAPGTPLR
ncbi:MAG: methionine--tRNA ligase [Deltaproteobacteria bacterium]|nr:methionine--tRNA ligase [Deltaproteobacteria bacterium]